MGAGGGYAPGNAGGEGFVTLSVGEMPVHTHPTTDPGHNHAYTSSYNTGLVVANGASYGG